MANGLTKMLTVAVAVAFAPVTLAHATVTISNGSTKNINCSAGTCTATRQNAVINAAALTGMLADLDVTIVADKHAQNIEVRTPVGWTSAHQLTLDARGSIAVSREVQVEGPGSLALNTGKKAGSLSFSGKGHVEFWDTSGRLYMNGRLFHLVDSIAMLARKIATHPSAHYALARSYDAVGDGTYAHSPVENFFGVFEGLGNTISKLSIANHDSSYVGLFGRISDTGEVRNLNLIEARISGDLLTNTESMGILVGYNEGAITGVSARGNVSSPGDRSYFMSNGGITGNNNGTIVGCAANVGIVVADGAVGGGIAGLNYRTIERSSASAHVTAGPTGGAIGVLVGQNSGTVTLSKADGSVVGGTKGYFGGLIGSNYGGTIDNSYATASVSAGKDSYVGGLTAYNEMSARVQFSYSTGHITFAQGGSVGGLIGLEGDESTTSSSDWDTDTSGITNLSQGIGNIANAPGVTGLTDAQLKSALPAGFDPNVWGQNPNINNGWPYLLANPPQ